MTAGIYHTKFAECDIDRLQALSDREDVEIRDWKPVFDQTEQMVFYAVEYALYIDWQNDRDGRREATS